MSQQLNEVDFVVSSSGEVFSIRAGLEIGTDEEFSTGTSEDKTASIKQITDSIDTKQDRLMNVIYTNTQLSTGVHLLDNQELLINGVVSTFKVLSTSGAGIITFVAHENLIIELPDGTGWSGGDTPRFVTNKLYNVAYFKGTFYVDGGR